MGSGPGRPTVALAEREIPALGIDVTPYAVSISRAAGAVTLLRDVFGDVPGTGRWMNVRLADGNIGIGGDPIALLRRVSELLTPLGQALVEVQPPGTAQRSEQVRLRHGSQTSGWFPWAYVGADQIAEIAVEAGLVRGRNMVRPRPLVQRAAAAQRLTGAQAAGAEVSEVSMRANRAQSYTVDDPEGHRWYFSEPLENGRPS